MSFNSWLQSLRSALAPSQGQRNHARRGSHRAATHRLNLEVLEDRRLLAFLAPVDYAVGSGTREIVSADFNNDTTLDLAVVNSSDNTVSVLLGNADGTFQPAVPHSTGACPVSLAVGDLDGDGKIDDLATANYDGNDVSVLLGNDDGTFQPARSSVGIGSRPWSIAVGDFNGDGLFDLGVTSNNRYEDYYYGYDRGTAHVLLGTGGGDFSGPNSTDLGYGAHDYALAADLNGDPYDDFMTFASFNTYGYVTVLLGDSSGYLQGPSGSFPTGDYSHLAAGDLDGDGDNDLVMANFYGKSVGVLLGDGSGGFSGPVNYATGESPLLSIVLGDFTHDGNLDVATTNHGSNQVSVLYGDGAGAFSAPAVFATGSRPLDVAAGDFNGDGWLDAVTVSNNAATVSVLINDQSWSSPPPPTVSVSDATASEGNTGTVNATFTLTLLYASTVNVTVHYATANISAAAGSDYTAASGDVIIPAGQTSRTFAVAVKGDRLAEPTETFAVNLISATNATIGDGQGVGAILDNEPRISISDVTKAEGKKNQTTLFTFTVTLSAAYDQAVTMSYRTVNGTAKTSDGDYIAKTGTLTFAPGQTSKTITIEVKGDSKREANETFYLDLFGLSSNALFTKNRGIGTILNDD